jgi:hypothetical protein
MGCAGARHGWPGALVLAQPSATEDRANFRASADQAWSTASRSSHRPTFGKKTAATDQVKSEIIDWLAVEVASPVDSMSAMSGDAVNSIGDLLATTVTAELDHDSRSARSKELRRALTDHFWCDMLAAFSCAMNELSDQFDKIPERLVSAVWKSRTTDMRQRVRRNLVQLAITASLKGIRELPVGRNIDDLRRVTKILAILICPAPERHRSVVECCVFPMDAEIISDTAKQRLIELLPPDWRIGRH